MSLQTSSALLGGYALRDTTRGGGFFTTDMNNLGSIPIVGDALPLPPLLLPGTLFTDSDNVWGDGTPGNRQSAAVDAHFGQQTTYDYFHEVHGRDGIDGAGRMGYSRVHYGNKYNNAFWYDLCFCMTYGDGDGSILAPLTSLDVAGHEMTHGITSQTAGLAYEGESGGLNEATSDIFGSLVEYYANTSRDPGDYFIGETIYTPGTPGDALRYMNKPSLDGKSPDCWSPSLASLCHRATLPRSPCAMRAAWHMPRRAITTADRRVRRRSRSGRQQITRPWGRIALTRHTRTAAAG